ncbi:hypothetical protein BU24DRAFT_416375 [Aaosphaeria arxii CBS 175.79]|uniref:Stress-response A/B barrel domain-containing protein n=1 Tax=Aaosphaeria arxii CBS 175.79 TaxID=1450172 RepID=A0A6A5Y5X9_9PLEO|nr:uncharacterized protein BU24DRAFT_416375 [Aaosphaeria arxii CBS 175.79]KAF2020686.1 hypothetical protein BU24DRAFT_416375 [Aaosphaeria arxii CBS 175.79]
MPKIARLTLFKIPDPANVQEAIKKYSTLTQDALKDGKQYIQQAQASPTHDDPRRQGITLVARTVFESKADMDFYDNECTAHVEIKKLLKQIIEAPPIMLYMDLQ